MSMESAMPFNHLILYCPLLLLPSVFPRIGVFSNESALHIRWPKYWSFSMSLCNEYSGLISFRMDWLDLLAVQGTLKSLLQHHSSKAWVHIESDSLYILYHQWSDNINTHISQNQSHHVTIYTLADVLSCYFTSCSCSAFQTPYSQRRLHASPAITVMIPKLLSQIECITIK